MSEVIESERETRLSADGLIRLLEDDILNSVLKPGDRLDEQSLARRFEVSRTPVREALRHLASSGLIDIRKNQGATVKRLTTAELIEMFQVMAEYEGLSARLSARRMTTAEIAEMRNWNEECRVRADKEDHDGFYAANNMFHEAIFHGSRNEFLQEESRKLRNRLNAYRRHITTQPRRMQKSVIEHGRIADAIVAGDEDTAHSLMRQHVDLLAGTAADVLLALESETTE
ncbi:GntR family transcriptional regulator [Borborobacter arsenicus]|uniref:GntR family transcriptional regulator n=1 Tax=Borborobacter arsenicus TaxID=1851146 RepID=UPI001AEC85EE|nr:GntR family transcriptional regulator [Pseudaminobacter arsenicus]